MSQSSGLRVNLRRGVLTTAVLACLLVSPVSAEEATVTEGETAQFFITASYDASSQSRRSSGPSRIRLSYKTLNGTAIAGQDYDGANWWNSYVYGAPNSALKIEVKTFEDDVEEGDETFSIQIVSLAVWNASNFWSAGGQWQRVSLPGSWSLEGARKAVIRDGTK